MRRAARKLEARRRRLLKRVGTGHPPEPATISLFEVTFPWMGRGSRTVVRNL
jgi:hypothetical protein